MSKYYSYIFRRDLRKEIMFLTFATLPFLGGNIHCAAQDNGSNSAIAIPANIKELTGKQIDYDHYKDYVTVGRPWEETDKIFLFYNIGTGKFLNVGSYWGTHAVLSDVPRTFWLQRRNEKYVSGLYSYLRYPESATNTGNFKNDFFIQKSLKVGSVEGTVGEDLVRSHVTYKYIRVINNSDNSVAQEYSYTKNGDYSPNGATFEDNLNVDFTKQRIEAVIDMSGCKATYNSGESSDGKVENIISLGDRIDVWQTTSTPTNTIHIYGSKTTTGNIELRVNCFDPKYKEATHKTIVDLSKTTNATTATLVISQGSVKVNSVECCPKPTEEAYDSEIKPFLNLTHFEIGSTQGDNRSNAHYNYVNVVKKIRSTKTVPAIEAGYVNTGEPFSERIDPVDFANGDKIETIIDLTSNKKTGSTNYNIFSIGTAINLFGNDKALGEAHNVQIYYQPNGKNIIAYAADNANSSWNQYTKTKVWDGSSNLNITLSSEGLSIDGEVLFDASNRIINDLLNTYNSKLYIGSCEGSNRSYATYVSTTATKQAEAEAENEIAHEKDSNEKFETILEGNIKEKPIRAEIDLTNCTNTNENVLSIGTNIEKWGTESGIATSTNNIHFYYTPTSGSATNGTLNIDVASQSQSSYFYQILNYPLTSKTLSISLSEKGLYVNGTHITSSTKGSAASKGTSAAFDYVINYLTNEATSFSVGSKEGSTHHNQATYNKLAWLSTGMTTTSLFADKDGNGESFKESDIDLDFSLGDYIEADIDLASCTTKYENILSIGDNIDKWGQSEAANNLHIYLRNTDWTDNNLYVVYVNKDHSDDFKRAFTVKKDTDGKAILHLKLSSDGLFINDVNMYPAVNPMPTVTYDPDKAGDIVRFKQIGDNIFAKDDEGKYIIADDNDQDAHGVYVANSNYIYTTESRTDKTFPLFISSRFNQESDDKDNQGQFFGWAPRLVNADRTWGSTGVFGDRDLPQVQATTAQSIESSQWYFKPVDYTDESGKKQYVYQIYLRMTDVEVPARTGEYGSDKFKWNTLAGKKDYYLQATSEQVFGNNLCNYGGGIDLSESSNVKPEDYTDVDALSSEPSQADLSYWKIIDVTEYYDLFKAANTEMSQMLDLTFQLRDPDFSRLSADLPNWNVDAGLQGKIRIGYDNYNKKAVNETDYTTDKNEETKANDQHASNHARYMGVDIKGEDATGNFYQTVTLYNAGWYAIRCGGFSSAGASLFAQYGEGESKEIVTQPLHQLTQKEYDFLNKTGGMVWPYENGMPMYNALVAMNDDQAGSDGTETGKDGAKVVEKYTNQLVFFIDPDMLTANNGSIDITYGISLSSGGNIDLLSEDGGESTSGNTTEAPYTDSAWTVFDNFHLLFGGNDGEPFLILDEDDENVNHLDNSIHKYRSGMVDGKDINKKLYLHRTFTAGKWNSIMLPVGLTKAQYDEMFKEVNEDGTTKREGSVAAPLAELTELTDRTINFTTVKSETQYEGKDANGKLYDETAYWLKPMTPYIVKPTISEGSDTEGYTAHLYTWESQGMQYLEKNVGGKNQAGQKCFVIEHINMVEGVVKAEQKTDITTFGSKWDFAHMTTSVYTIKDGSVTLADCPYVMKGQVADQNGTMTAYGHLAKNFTVDGNGKRLLIENRAAMADSYSISGNKLTYLKSGAASKGFRCWFHYTKDTSGTASAKPMLVLDGIDMTTGIEDIIANDEAQSPISRFANGIYTMDGRRVSKNANDIEKLPKGMYIVNGKKQIVK